MFSLVKCAILLQNGPMERVHEDGKRVNESGAYQDPYKSTEIYWKKEL